MDIRKLALEWSKTSIFMEKVASARRIIRKYKGRRCYIACSGGKDSLALAHLVLREIPDALVFHWDHGSYLMPREVEKDILRCIYSIAPKEQVVVLSSRRLESRKARWDYRIWYRCFFGSLASFISRHKLEVGFLGLRAEESVSRKVRASRIEETDEPRGVVLVYPLWNWSWKDVWAYIFANKIRFPRVYYSLAKIYGWDRARLVTFFDKEFEHFGNITVSKFLFPYELNKP